MGSAQFWRISDLAREKTTSCGRRFPPFLPLTLSCPCPSLSSQPIYWRNFFFLKSSITRFVLFVLLVLHSHRSPLSRCLSLSSRKLIFSMGKISVKAFKEEFSFGLFPFSLSPASSAAMFEFRCEVSAFWIGFLSIDTVQKNVLKSPRA